MAHFSVFHLSVLLISMESIIYPVFNVKIIQKIHFLYKTGLFSNMLGIVSAITLCYNKEKKVRQYAEISLSCFGS